MKGKSAAALYFLLILLAGISMAYYITGAIALREEFFHSARYAREPFGFRSDGQTLTSLGKEAKAAGLSDGEVLVSVSGKTFTGWGQIHDLLQGMRPRDVLQVGVRTPSGQTQQAQIRLAPREGPDFSLGGLIAFLTPILGVPLLGLIVAYWVVGARPRDLNAWLVFPLLAFSETSFGNLDWSFWPSPWYIIFGLWNATVQTFVFAALLWFGIYFPERWRMDRRWPWIKWLVLAATLCGFAVEVWVIGARYFDVHAVPSLLIAELWADRLLGLADESVSRG